MAVTLKMSDQDMKLDWSLTVLLKLTDKIPKMYGIEKGFGYTEELWSCIAESFSQLCSRMFVECCLAFSQG